MREREREREHTLFKPYPGPILPGVVSVALCFFIVYVGLCSALDFPQIGFLFAMVPEWVCGGRWRGVVPCGAVCRLCYMSVPVVQWISHKLEFVLCWLQKGVRRYLLWVSSCVAQEGVY